MTDTGSTQNRLKGGRHVVKSHLIPSNCCQLGAASPPLHHPFELIATSCHEILLQRHDTCTTYKVSLQRSGKRRLYAADVGHHCLLIVPSPQ